jgi:hypothetical protein
MKTVRLLSFAAALAAIVVLLTSCASTAPTGSTRITDAPVAGANNLQVVMTIPPSWYPMLEDRIDDAFVSHLADICRRQGFNGNIVDVRQPDQPNPNFPILNITLQQWRMDHAGSVQCTFGASLQTSAGTRQLGVFDGMAMRWLGGPGRFGLSDTYGNAADDALRQLATSLARTGLVAGFPQP